MILHLNLLRASMTGKDSNAKTSSMPAPAGSPAQSPIQGAPADSTETKNMISEHKGKLAIGVAATLGVMVFYNWRRKNLSKEDPEGYALLQRFKNSVKADDDAGKNNHHGKPRKPVTPK
jgi:hypothetical protein